MKPKPGMRFAARGLTPLVPCPGKGCGGKLRFSVSPPAAYHDPAEACRWYMRTDVLTIIRTVNKLMEKK